MKRELTAKEQQDILDNDPAYQAMIAEKRRVWAAQAEMLTKNQQPLVAALLAKGWPATIRQCNESGRSIYDFVNTVEPYPHLYDTMAEHLQLPYHPRIKEGIVRALAVRDVRGTYIPALMMAELKKLANPTTSFDNMLRFALIYVLSAVGDSSMTDDVRSLLADEKFSSNRKELERLAKAIQRGNRRPPAKPV